MGRRCTNGKGAEPVLRTASAFKLSGKPHRYSQALNTRALRVRVSGAVTNPTPVCERRRKHCPVASYSRVNWASSTWSNMLPGDD